VKRHGDKAAILDTLGFSSGDAVLDNISTIEGAIERGHERADQLRQLHGWLHMTVGVKAQIFAIDAELKEQYMNLVAKSDDDNALAQDELRNLVAARDSY
jgi:hypothetical protein